MNKRLGLNIYMLRKNKQMTQDDLADVLNVSKMAVSKWERGINFPDIEIMCTMADYFNISLDELIGRKECLQTLNSLYNKEKIDCLEMAKKIIQYATLAQAEGFLAIETEVNKGKEDKFLTFVVETTMDGLRRSYDLEKIENILTCYVEKEENKNCANLCIRGILMIIDGINIEDIKEEIAIQLGKEYRKYLMGDKKEDTIDYTELLKRKCKVDLLENIFKTEKEKIGNCIRNIDNMTLSMALNGASGEVCVYILDNFIDDQLRLFMYEDIFLYEDTNLEDIYNAQLQMKKFLL